MNYTVYVLRDDVRFKRQKGKMVNKWTNCCTITYSNFVLFFVIYHGNETLVGFDNSVFDSQTFKVRLEARAQQTYNYGNVVFANTEIVYPASKIIRHYCKQF